MATSVSAAAGGLPIYRVVALTDREAWVRDEGRVEVQRMPISRLYWKAAEVCPNGVNG